MNSLSLSHPQFNVSLISSKPRSNFCSFYIHSLLVRVYTRSLLHPLTKRFLLISIFTSCLISSFLSHFFTPTYTTSSHQTFSSHFDLFIFLVSFLHSLRLLSIYSSRQIFWIFTLHHSHFLNTLFFEYSPNFIMQQLYILGNI